ncbi:cystathionine gamma-lyase-like [Eurosta solidaginis]|uniref:cystathionine gamma-lyase-like n=1 Tax=Eurosta solidaginis TaxID=178769 RepID=UPI0035306B39
MTTGFKKQPKGFATKAIHAGQNPLQWSSKSIVPPIYLSTTYKQDGPGEYESYDYSRSGNPTRTVLEKCLAALDGAEYGLAFASGLGATTAIFSLLNAGDHLVVGDDVYGGTSRLIRQIMSRLGIEHTFVDATDLAAVGSAIQANTKLVWVESPTNPLMKVVDIIKISQICNKNKVLLAVDNTFLTPYFQRPLELGADMVCYSLTKYMNGHSDVVMGAIILNSEDLYNRLKFLQNSMGIVPSPFDCYQVNRGLKTLHIRMELHQKNSIAVAKFLEGHPFVEKVMHPALPSHPQHQIALKQTYGYSGVFSFYIKGGLEQSKAFLQNLKIIALAESLGGYESLAELPEVMTHASIPEEIRKKLGINAALIRLSIGLEDIDDLIQDVENALSKAMNL